MIVHDVEQGSREWWALRLGKPTVSRFPRIITAKKLEYASGARTLAAELIAERILGRPLDWGVSQDTVWTERGTDMEEDAALWYELHRGVDTKAVGFITTDGGKFGGSPDRLVLGPDGEPVGGLEIKCRNAGNHMKCVLGIDPTAERLQVQGYLWLTGLPWWDVLAFNPTLPKRIDRVRPDPDVFEAIDTCLDLLLADIDAAEKRLESYGGVVETDDDGLIEALYGASA